METLTDPSMGDARASGTGDPWRLIAPRDEEDESAIR
jgi:hypothetical protein